MSQSLLYIIGTPLGNRNDITGRAKEVLQSLSYIFAEDTRDLRKLLKMLDISTKGKVLLSYSSHNMRQATQKAIEILITGNNVGLVSDRGTPCISDPGMLLVARAWDEGFSVQPIPGISSVTVALSVSGFSADQFLFLGFLPQKSSLRNRYYQRIEILGTTSCFFVSPREVNAVLAELAAKFPRGRLFVAREMTKVFESFQRFELSNYENVKIVEQGEFTLVLEPGEKVNPSNTLEQNIELRVASDKEWSRILGRRLGIASSSIYNALQKHKKQSQK